jgi:hypothetical protein
MATRLYIVHEGWVTCPSRWTVKCGGSPSQGPNPDSYGATPTTASVTSLNVGLGSTFNLIDSRVTQVPVSEGLKKGAEGVGFNALSP